MNLQVTGAGTRAAVVKLNKNEPWYMQAYKKTMTAPLDDARRIYEGLHGKRAWYICHPHSIGHGIWDLFIALILLGTFILIPLNCFDEFADALMPVNLIIDIMFCIDIVKQFFTGRSIMHHTAHGWQHSTIHVRVHV